MNKCDLGDDKKVKKLPRVSFNYEIYLMPNARINVLRWLNRSIVNISSTLFLVFPLSSLSRYDKSLIKTISIDYPNIVKIYNTKMGGVDLFDMLMALYRLDHKSKKWYIRIFF